MKKNILRELINDNKPTIGTHVLTVWPGMTEVIGHAGTIDYVEFTATYTPHDLFALENFGRTIDLFENMSSMIKLDQEPRTYLAKKAVNSGIQNALFADVRTVEDVEECVASMKPDTPTGKGKAGVAMSRHMGYIYPNNTSLADSIKSAEDGVIALMIEKKTAVENLESLLSVPGVDMVQFGPGDYSINIGRPGDTDHPEIKEAELYTIQTSQKMDIRPRVEIATWEQAKPYLELCVKDFSLGVDLAIIHDYCKTEGKKLIDLLNS